MTKNQIIPNGGIRGRIYISTLNISTLSRTSRMKAKNRKDVILYRKHTKKNTLSYFSTERLFIYRTCSLFKL